jgi:hypothetical protein
LKSFKRTFVFEAGLEQLALGPSKLTTTPADESANGLTKPSAKAALGRTPKMKMMRENMQA